MTIAHRPPGAPRIVASDLVYADPGEAWDTLPTKVEPSAGMNLTGAVPNQPINAEHDNWRANDWTRRLAAIDLIEVQNFTEPGDGKGTFSPTGSSFVAGMAWIKGQSSSLPRILACGDGESILSSIDGGYTWTTEYTPVAAADFIDLCDRNSHQTAGAIYLDAGVYKFARMSVAGSWVNATATDATDLNAIAGDPYRDYFWVVGGTAGTGYIRRWEDDSAPAYANFDGGATNFHFVAVGPTAVLAATQGGQIYKVADPAGAAVAAVLVHDNASPGLTVGLVYLEPQALFVLFTSDFAAGSAEIWTSADLGSTWTQVGAATAALLGIVAGSCLARGSVLYSAGTKNDLGAFLHVSGDAGATWDVLPDPLARHQSLAVVPQTTRIRSVGNRIMVAGYVAAGQIAHALSVRGGPIS